MSFPAHLWSDVTVVGIFGAVAILLLIVAYKIWDWMTKDIDEQKQLNNNNVAVAIVLVGYLFSVAYILGQVIGHVLGG